LTGLFENALAAFAPVVRQFNSLRHFGLRLFLLLHKGVFYSKFSTSGYLMAAVLPLEIRKTQILLLQTRLNAE
jgi:hypothetical protein